MIFCCCQITYVPNKSKEMVSYFYMFTSIIEFSVSFLRRQSAICILCGSLRVSELVSSESGPGQAVHDVGEVKG